MEYVVPLIIVLVIVIVAVVGSRMVGRRGRSQQGSSQLGSGGQGGNAHSPDSAGRKRAGRDISREHAEAAGERLTPEAHRVIYSLIAQNQMLGAVMEYRNATGVGLGESAAAVAALAQFPQPTPEPETPAVAADPAIKEGALTVQDIINPAPESPAEQAPDIRPAVPETVAPEPQPVAAPGAYRYRAIVSRGGEIREVASTRLNEEIFQAIRKLAISGDYDGASRLLRDHSDVGASEAQEFVHLIDPES
ncbi:hypothetical protein AAGW05_06115 [Arthrobacter sp. LAPM80]|uniref:hypothetical protein n=1 Tax=Arthrobacter sp. LAPM80 TaxID=3141788 RepID=UPI00398BBB5B